MLFVFSARLLYTVTRFFFRSTAAVHTLAGEIRSIATLAITTLLKTGSEGSVDRLMKQISSFMNEIADEFKIVVVKAIRQVCVCFVCFFCFCFVM